MAIHYAPWLAQLYHRSSLGHEGKTLAIGEALRGFCLKNKISGPNGRVAHHYDSGVNPSELGVALTYIERVLETLEPIREIAQKAAVTEGVMKVIAQGHAVPHTLARHVAGVINAHGGPIITPVPWADMSWGRQFVQQGEVRHAIDVQF
jgi:hypothetical protein